MEETKTPDARFKTMVRKMFKYLRRRMDDFSENLKRQ